MDETDDNGRTGASDEDGQVRQMKMNLREEYNGMAVYEVNGSLGCAVRVNIFENRGTEFQTRRWQKTNC